MTAQFNYRYFLVQYQRLTGGEGGIRTPDRLAPMPHFECGAFDHSATSPSAKTGGFAPPRSGRVLGEDGGPDKNRVGIRSNLDGPLDDPRQRRRVPCRAHRRRAAAA